MSPPASEELLREAEAALGITLPNQLRALYLEADGFREPKGNTKYLFSLLEEDGAGSLVGMTRFWWDDWPEVSGQSSERLREFVFFGMASGNENWGISLSDPEKIIAFHHHYDEPEFVGTNIMDVYRDNFARYDQL